MNAKNKTKYMPGVRLTRPGANPARDAERRIEADVKALASSGKGVNTLCCLRDLLRRTDDLGLRQSSLLVSLTRSAFVGGNRDRVLLEINKVLEQEGK